MSNTTTNPKTSAPRKILKPIIKPTDPVKSEGKGCCCSGSNQIEQEKSEESTKSCCSKS